MAKIYVKNVNGSSTISPKPKAGEGSCWRDFWADKAGFTFVPNDLYTCPGCNNARKGSDFEGCHVIKVNSNDKKWYIVPMCHACNMKHGHIFLIDEDLLIAVNPD